MSSSFSGMSIAARGLSVNQMALNITGHNVSNMDTEGYVRQRVVQIDTSYLKTGSYKIGTGVGIEEIMQIRSTFLDDMYRSQQSSLSYWQMKQSAIEDIEAVMDDLSDSGSLENALNNFFNAWDEVSKDPTGGSERASLLEYANSLVEIINGIDDQLDQMQENFDLEIKSMVDDINSIAQQVARLNEVIANCEIYGGNANDYRDEANTLLDTLSEYVNVSITISNNGMYNVSIGGVSLVNGIDYKELTSVANSSNGAFNTVIWDYSGAELKLKDGMLLGLIESRGDVNGDRGSTENGSLIETDNVDSDAQNYNFTGESNNLIPELRTGLNIFVNLLARKINSIHSAGEDLNGDTGTEFFVKIDDSLPFEIGNIQINPELEDTDKIIASSIDGNDDGAIATEIAGFIDTEYFLYDGLEMNINEYYSMLVNWVGTQGEEAENNANNQDTLVQQIESNKESLSAVSTDEELANLIKFQHAYNASAQLMSTIDSMIAIVIENMGIVGR
jgi:flagellar hook-associated protein 1 FlgK